VKKQQLATMIKRTHRYLMCAQVFRKCPGCNRLIEHVMEMDAVKEKLDTLHVSEAIF